MFTFEERACLRAGLLEYAAKDERITGAAVTGSAADSHEDQWSDIDLAFGVSVAANLAAVLSDWTANIYSKHLALHHVDVLFGAWTYRVFLLPNTLQVDLAFVVETEFRALAPTFRLVFGKANEPRDPLPTQAGAIIGMAWLYALHARSSIARQRLWQAEYMIRGVRDHALTLACIRYGLPAGHGKGFDLLPSAVTDQFLDSFVRRLEAEELARAFRVVIQALVKEIRSADEELGVRLQEVLAMLTKTSS